MKERLLKFLETESLTAGKFADEIGVQPSSISHILSGRNNPGFEFFQKVLKRYTHLNAEWLLMGTGKMTKAAQQSTLFASENIQRDDTEVRSLFNANKEPVISLKDQSAPPKKEDVLNLNMEGDNELSKRIEKIIILFADSSFREYKPAK